MEEEKPKRKNSRNKGARGELELANLLTKLGYESRRGQQYSGLEGQDVVSYDFPFHIECKRVQALNVSKAMAQSAEDAKEKPPCVIHRKNGEQWHFTCKLTDLVKVLTWLK